MKCYQSGKIASEPKMAVSLSVGLLFLACFHSAYSYAAPFPQGKHNFQSLKIRKIRQKSEQKINESKKFTQIPATLIVCQENAEPLAKTTPMA